MKSNLECIYKGIKETKAGSFINEKGENVQYKDSYKIIIDQYINNIPKETYLKIGKELALNISQTLLPYDKIVINFDVTIYKQDNITFKITGVNKK